MSERVRHVVVGEVGRTFSNDPGAYPSRLSQRWKASIGVLLPRVGR